MFEDYLLPYLPEIARGLSWPALAVFAALALISVCATVVTLFKLLQFPILGVGRRRSGEKIIGLWLAGNGAGALRLAQGRGNIRARVLFAALSALKAFPSDKDYARELAVQTAEVELASMARGMRGLDAMVQAAPLLGLFGTLLAMAEAFAATGGALAGVTAETLAPAIWTGLYSTMAGLGLALVFALFAAWFDARIVREKQALEHLISSFLHGRVDATAARRKG